MPVMEVAAKSSVVAAAAIAVAGVACAIDLLALVCTCRQQPAFDSSVAGDIGICSQHVKCVGSSYNEFPLCTVQVQ